MLSELQENELDSIDFHDAQKMVREAVYDDCNQNKQTSYQIIL